MGPSYRPARRRSLYSESVMSNRLPASHVEPPAGRVVLRVAEMARQRGIVNISGRWRGRPHLEAIRDGTGLSYQALYTLLRRPDRVQRIDLATLERLCAYFQCAPGELIDIDWNSAPHPREHTETVNPLSSAWQSTRPEWEQIMRARLGGQRAKVRPEWPELTERERTLRAERERDRQQGSLARADW
jgi:DNA-binding Xre family transcriptional regulator